MGKESSYDKNGAEYWAKKEPRVMGDILNRPPAIKMLGDIGEHDVLEAGCGTGYVARMLAEKGAKVYGCDISDDMLAQAAKAEEETPQGIEYVRADITELPYADESMDNITSVGVLIHNSEEKIQKFLSEARRVLKKGGSLVIGITHPDLFKEGSVSRSDGANWVKHFPLEDKLHEQSQLFKEDYLDKDGKLFVSEVWHHTQDTYKKLVEQAGLKIVEVEDQILKKEDLVSLEWGDEYGYPAFLHIKAIKE